MPVSSQEVVWLYRSLLGREPESEAVVRQHMQVADIAVLTDAFVRSPEFRQRHGSIFAPPQFPMALEPDDVQSDASPAQLQRLFEHIKASWTYLGETRPHFSVLTIDGFLPENLAGNARLFWDSGHANVEGVRASLARHGLTDLSNLSCVEYGCGVGRLTMALGGLFADVHAYDISRSHLDIAMARADELGVRNVTFHERRDDFLGPLEGCDVFVSIIVLQHNPPPIIKVLIRRALESLRPGGVALFQAPTHLDNYRFDTDSYLADAPPRQIEMHYLPQREIFALAAETGCEVLEVRPDSWVDGWGSDTFAIRRPPAGAA